MARPRKLGLSYFPLDVDIFEDDKLFDLQDKYGPLGETIYLRLLCLVYKNGYYFEFGSIEKLTNMIVKSIGNKWVRDKKTVSEVIPFLAKINLFSSELMQENVLTSRSIQRRYREAAGRRQPNTKKYWLLDENESQEALVSAVKNEVSVYNNPVSVYNNPVNVDNNDTKVNKTKVNKIKVNKTKVNKIKVNKSKVVLTLPALDNQLYEISQDKLNELQQIYKHIDVLISLNHIAVYLQKNTEKRQSDYEGYIKMWLQRDDDTALKAKTEQLGMNGTPSYDLEEYQKTSMFDD